MNLKLKIVIAFAILVLASLVGDLLPNWFLGDWKCNGNYCISTHTVVKTHWGFRHSLLIGLGLTLFILQIVSIINNELNKK